MSLCPEFDEISVLIPGYSLEDLPTDLDEERAASLLNAAVTAWHPGLLAACRGLPRFRQAESLNHFSGRNFFLVPAPAEDWMPHEWQAEADSSASVAVGAFTQRDEWVSAIREALAQSTESNLPAADGICCVDDFYSFGLCYLLIVVISRRMHHFIDPDDATIEAEVRQAATAAMAGDEERTRAHLQKCFNSLRETREQFYPLDCYLLDLCVPPDDAAPEAMQRLLSTESCINLVASPRMLQRWCESDPHLHRTLSQSIDDDAVCLVTGGWSEQRAALGSMLATLTDLQRGQETERELFGSPVACWGRRRFGLVAMMPQLLRSIGKEFALHFALDDGVYPEQEHSWFDWQAPDGSRIPATSRIPIAIDSAASLLRFPDRCRESMQDDSSAILSFARLPEQKTTWPADLRRAMDWAPVLGQFVTFTSLLGESGIRGSRIGFQSGEYLTPHLIQASVIGNERPISDPAHLHLMWTRLSAVQTQQACAVMLGVHSRDVADQVRRVGRELNDLEAEQVGAPALEQGRPEREKAQQALLSLSSVLNDRLQTLIPVQADEARGLLIQNALAFGRMVVVEWPREWRPPQKSSAIVGFQSSPRGTVVVRLPPAGFVALNESRGRDEAAEAFRVPRREPPLAEPYVLRNRFFEVSISERSGGIEAVTLHGSRTNLLSQRPCFRFDRSQTVRDSEGNQVETSYAKTIIDSSRVLRNESILGEVETRFTLVSPVDGALIASGRQTVRVDRFRPRILLQIEIDALQREIVGNPWLTYIASRFAWDDSSAVVSRGVLGQAGDAEAERFETPDYLEVATEESQVVIAVHGRPYHRRSGQEMLDSLLVVEGEPKRRFNFTIDFNQGVPMKSVLDAVTPPDVRPLTHRVKSEQASGWLMGMTARHVMVVGADAVLPEADDAEQAGSRIRVTLMETDGIAVRSTLRLAKPCRAARIAGGALEGTELELIPEGVAVDFSPWQLVTLELDF